MYDYVKTKRKFGSRDRSIQISFLCQKFIEIKGNLCQLWYYYLGNPLFTAKGRTIVKTLTREAWFKRKLIAALGY